MMLLGCVADVGGLNLGELFGVSGSSAFDALLDCDIRFSLGFEVTVGLAGTVALPIASGLDGDGEVFTDLFNVVMPASVGIRHLCGDDLPGADYDSDLPALGVKDAKWDES
jgi:hypothetical protein